MTQRRRRGMPDGWTSLLVRMPPELHDAGKAAAAAAGLSFAEWMRRALADYCGDDGGGGGCRGG
jgi:predicted HicB family RNase H-like nuclease